MADTIRTLSALTALLADNVNLDVSAQDVRDVLVSVMGVKAYVAKSAAYTATDDDHIIECDASGGGFTITLPAVATTRLGKEIIVKKTDATANVVKVDANGAELIDTAADYDLTSQGDCIVLLNTQSKWILIGSF